MLAWTTPWPAVAKEYPRPPVGGIHHGKRKVKIMRNGKSLFIEAPCSKLRGMPVCGTADRRSQCMFI